MGWECGTCGKKVHASFGEEKFGIRKLEDAGVFWNIILLKWVLRRKEGCGQD
jgi:hypothetical protein